MSEKEIISPVNIEARKELGIRAGDTIRVTQKIQEKGKIRLQVFEGIVLMVKHGTEAGATFTVRKVASGVGVEKTFPLYSPMIDKIEIVKRTKVRRAKLYYIRKKAAKEIRRAMRKAFMVGAATESDIAEKERKVKEAESAAAKAKADEEAEKKKQEEEAKAAEETKKAEEEKAAEETKEDEKKEDAPEESKEEKTEKSSEDKPASA